MRYIIIEKNVYIQQLLKSIINICKQLFLIQIITLKLIRTKIDDYSTLCSLHIQIHPLAVPNRMLKINVL